MHGLLHGISGNASTHGIVCCNDWRKLAGGAEYQATIVSLLICNAYQESCHNIYFYLVVLLAGTSLAIAFWAAAILRRIEVDETCSHGTWVMRGAFPLGASVFLFSATTLFHQGWDLGISENNPAGEIFYLILIVVWLTAALFFSALALFAAKAIGRVTRWVLRHLGRWLSLVFLSLLRLPCLPRKRSVELRGGFLDTLVAGCSLVFLSLLRLRPGTLRI
jgi:hypothetical protein